MDQREIQSKLINGCILRFENAPDTMHLMLDGVQVTLNREINGVKMLPAGLHCLVYCHQQQHGSSSALPLCVWFCTDPGDFVVWEWNVDSESFQFEKRFCLLKNQSYDEHCQLLASMDNSLAPFPASSEARRQFVELSFAIDEVLLMHLLQTEEIETVSLSASTSSYHPALDISQDLSEQQPASLHSSFCRRLSFVEIDRHGSARLALSASNGSLSSERDRTDIMLNQSMYLQNLLILNSISIRDLIGEMQFSFLILIMAQNAEGLLQWHAILRLLSYCPDMHRSFHDLHQLLNRTLHAQFAFLETDQETLVSQLQMRNVLVNLMDLFPDDSVLLASIRRLFPLVDLDPDEDAPVIVDLN